ncbi:MAG: FAD-dependent oxidoreductase, partial [Planctomycetales bacterium]|nr:FAD-dependent oxidoreductase [Planctomycetales bacterium]
ASRRLSARETIERIPAIQQRGLRGGVLYYDAQFDDARLLVNMAQTACEQGAAVVNYARVIALAKNAGGRVCGLTFRDEETGDEHPVAARVVINATGPFADGLRRMDDPAASTLIAPSQGVHLVLDRRFLGGQTALIVPKTRDGRLLFAIGWHNAVLAGTTDTPIDAASLEPQALDEEVDFVLATLADYLGDAPGRSDVKSVFAGVRPLARRGGAKNTAALSRDHTIEVSNSNLVTIAGGKWTTYRRMAEDCVNRAAEVAGLEARPCRTVDLPIHGACDDADAYGDRWIYGSDAPLVERLAGAQRATAFDPRLTLDEADVVWAVRNEMARTVEDVLSRRTRALLLDAQAAIDVAPRVAQAMAAELGRDAAWAAAQATEFRALAARYLPTISHAHAASLTLGRESMPPEKPT